MLDKVAGPMMTISIVYVLLVMDFEHTVLVMKS